MKTERLENSNFKFSNRGFLVALAASSMLLMNSFNSMGKYSAGLKEITFVPKIYADDAMIIQLCKEAATNAHNDRMLSSRERADGLQNVTIGTYQILEHSNKAEEAIVTSTAPNVDVIPAHIDLVAIEIELVDKENREYMLKQALESIKDKYDYILIDCAPSLGLLTLNALTAADSVIIPIQCEYFALEGLGKLLNTIKSVQKIHNSNLDIEGLLLTMFDSRLRLSNQVVEEVQKHFNDMVFETIIQRNVKLSEAPSYGESIINYDATSKGANNYLRLAEEIIKKNSN